MKFEGTIYLQKYIWEGHCSIYEVTNLEFTPAAKVFLYTWLNSSHGTSGPCIGHKNNSRAFVLCWNLPGSWNKYSVIVDFLHLSIRVRLGQYGAQQHIYRISVQEWERNCIIYSFFWLQETENNSIKLSKGKKLLSEYKGGTWTLWKR